MAHPLNGKTYTLLLQHTGAQFPALFQEGLTTPGFQLVDCGNFVVDSNLSNWYWQVSVVRPDGSVIIASERRALNFAPCRLSNGQACSSP
jgi:hypothetical protein